MDEKSAPILVSEKGGVLAIKLNRPEVHNAFNAQMIAELTRIFSEVEKSSARVVFLSGEGKSFCAGADLAWMKSLVDYSFEENREDSLKLYDLFETVAECALPVVTKVQGNVFGGGLGIASASDIVIAEEKTRFCFSEVKLGLAPATISPFVMRKVSRNKASEWMLSAKLFEAQEALQGGLINFVGSAEKVEEETQALLQRMVRNGPEAVRETKRLMTFINNNLPATWKEETARSIAERRVSAEGQEGLQSFFDKRSPAWVHKEEQ